MLRPASAGELGAGQRRKLEAVKKADAASWSVEVVEALCRRLPGGDVTITAPCERCKCIVWPCLCALDHAPRSRNSTLRPPRILEEHEMRRLGREAKPDSSKDIRSHHGKALGNLSFVSSRRSGMDRDRLHVVSTADADAIAGTIERHSCRFMKANVVSRKGDEYIVQLDKDSNTMWEQQVKLNIGDLKLLFVDRYLDDELMISRDVDLKSTQKMVVYKDRYDAEKDIGLTQVDKQWYVKEVWIPADHKATTDRKTSMPRRSGKAYEEGIRTGHKLAKLHESFAKQMNGELQGDDECDHNGTWHKLENMTDYLPGVFDIDAGSDDRRADPTVNGLTSTSLRKSHSSTRLANSGDIRYEAFAQSKGKDELDFPCKLTFLTLTRGWRITGVNYGEGDNAKQVHFRPAVSTEGSPSLKAERPDGEVKHYEGESEKERLLREGVKCPDGEVKHYESDTERLVRVEYPNGEVHLFEGAKGTERMVRVEYSDVALLKSKLKELAGLGDVQKKDLHAQLQMLKDSTKLETTVTLFCTQTPYEVVSRAEFKVRHEHVWEGMLKGDRQQDAEMLSDWCLNAKLTPAQLSFAFREVRQSLQKELDLFQKERLQMQDMLVLKGMKILRMQKELESQQGESSTTETAHKLKQMRRGIQNTEVELRFLLQQVPLHFLVELRDACVFAHKTNLGSFPGNSDSRSKETKQLMQEFKDLIASQPTAARGNPSRALRYLREKQAKLAATQPPTEKRRVTKTQTNLNLGDKAGHVPQSMVLQFFMLLHRHTSEAIEVGEEGKLQSDGWLEKGKGVLKETSKASSNITHKSAEVAARDGRMSRHDFEKVMMRCGITWLTTEELDMNFRAMDKDGSGFLTLAEVLVFSQRLMELLLLVKDFEMELKAAGEKTEGQDDLIQQFVKKLMFGNDLVGGVLTQVIDDEFIKVHPEPVNVKFSIVQTRLDYIGEPWMADVPEDSEDAWIEWTLPCQKLITAVVTRGDPRPGYRNWVTAFDLKFFQEADNLKKENVNVDACKTDGNTGAWSEVECETANVDGITRAWFPLVEPVKALRVRLTITAWEGMEEGRKPALRATLFGQTVKD
eukprot:TRINITY_DN17411_c0_g1_i1.p1 TRINITY_DN17411_c0_g1~~TRINITY_DN17411_c0_g1_i1.p1  ORF type:complete len:1082 (-),score=186.15 TRINITY_DN17411_c0_g1_i1:320-3565(-)